ncbi:MAG: filamentous hemagglutinin N-terminal domain-containing protein [Cyanobacteria bacterium P01_A01_bin.40]
MSKFLSSLLRVCLCTLGFSLANSQISLSQITSDNTVNTQVTQNGNVAEITGGETRGANLFHSFQDFSVPTDNIADFQNANIIGNIFSRITGGNVSNIDGIIRANGSANLFLINPAGIMFGENASLNIGGSFYGSSASSILFENGEFSTDLDNPPILTVNAPIGLGFRDNPGEIINRSLALSDSSILPLEVGLEVLASNTLALIGGNIVFETGSATAEDGNIELGGLSEAGIVDINQDGSLSFPENVALADVTIADGADVSVLGIGSGNITINARNLDVSADPEAGVFRSRSRIRAGVKSLLNSPDVEPGNVKINVTENLSISDSRISSQIRPGGIGNIGNISITAGSISLINGGRISSSSFGEGDAGNIQITAQDSISIDGEDFEGEASLIDSRTDGDIFGAATLGSAGEINIETGSLFLTNGGQINTRTISQGDAGNIKINAIEDINIDGETFDGTTSNIQTIVAPGAEGDAGSIGITSNNLTLANGGAIAASTLGRGNGGDIGIATTKDINVDGESSKGSLSNIQTIVAPDAEGDAGSISITSNNLTLTNGSTVAATTVGIGNAGSIDITAAQDVTIDGETFDGVISNIQSLVFPDAEGDAGSISITSNNLTLTNGGTVAATTGGIGDAGDINIAITQNVAIDGEDSLGRSSNIASAVLPSAEGNAGSIDIASKNLALTNGGIVAATTLGRGNAGSIDISVSEDVNIDGENSDGTIQSTINNAVEIGAVGDSGGITISTNNLILTNNGIINSASGGQGNAGSVIITAKESIQINGADERIRSGIFANALIDNGNGGNINIFTDLLTIEKGGTIEASNFDSLGVFNPGTGQPGNISIDANFINLVNKARIDTVTQSETGSGANINLEIADSIFLSGDSFISAQALGNANGGNLSINTNFIVAFPEGNNDIIASAEQGQGGILILRRNLCWGLKLVP